MKKRLNSEKIIKRLKEERNELRKRGVKRIGLFGSYVKGKQKQKSDIDFLIEFKKIDADNFFNLLFLLERMFKRKIDLVDAKNLRPELEYVKKEAKYVEI
jgi:predicted nucleotidyltransferase